MGSCQAQEKGYIPYRPGGPRFGVEASSSYPLLP